MKLTCNDTLYTYDAYHLLKAFYPDEEIEQQVDEEQESQIRIESDCDSCFCVTLAGEKTELLQMDRGEKKHLAVRSLYEKCSCREIASFKILASSIFAFASSTFLAFKSVWASSFKTSS